MPRLARYHAIVGSPRSAAETFGYLARFSNARQWDPAVVRARQLDPGLVDVGTRFRLTVSFLGVRMPLDYIVTRYAPPVELVLRATNWLLTAKDTIELTTDESGTVVSYLAEVTLHGPAQIFDRALTAVFARVAPRAVAGLADALNTVTGSTR
jgi:Polyketide cyclase / dehydrase and lipid transport